MSLSFDDRILGEKVYNYCSSSEDEGEEEGEESENDEGPQIPLPQSTEPEAPPPTMQYNGYSTNTGPKGVINDWRRYKQLETEKRSDQERERGDICKKFSTTCRTYNDDLDAHKREENLKERLEELEDEFIEEYRRRRMEEMRRHFSDIPRFGDVMNLTKESFISAIDDESSKTLIIVHIYESNSRGCEAVHGCLQCLAPEYPTVKFCRIRASDAEMSRNFSRDGVPAIVVYRNKQLIGNLINVSKKLGEDFFASDMESFLLEHGFLPDKVIDPAASTIRSAALHEDSDSDFDLD